MSKKKREKHEKEQRHEEKRKAKKYKKSYHGHSLSSSPPSPLSLIKVLEERRLQQRLKRKREKEEMKAKETPEEKRARRLLEKNAKEQRRRQRMGWDKEYQHYTNQDNPFGDSNLTSTFVWDKKLDKEGLKNAPLEEIEALSRQKQLANKFELEKVKKRRLEREQERQMREEEIIVQQREKEAAQFQEWERQEDKFHLEQARLRSAIRIQDGRAKSIDLIAQYISSSKLDDAIEMQMHEPYLLLNGLGTKDLEDLLEDIKVYVELEKGKNNDFWDDMTVIAEDELKKLRKLELRGEFSATVGSRREGIHSSVVKEVTDIFRGKNTTQLNELRCRIETKINSRNDGVDISYWESLLSQLKAHMARARLRDRHQISLQQKLKLLRTASEEDEPESAVAISQEEDQNNIDELLKSANEAHILTLENTLESCFKLYKENNYSPIYILENEIDSTITLLSEVQDEQRSDCLRANYIQGLQQDKVITQEELQMRCEARRGMLADEAEFSVETPLDTQVHLITDKYRPRKPRYFNRVHTGFEWNKYNQTHYDMDNPPPKIVQGYKFNIFYPDLIDKSSTPQYFLTQCQDNPDFAILRFYAGPPYEDIAFKIVHREWEFSYKRGFRCQFHNNIFQLWFHFKRYRYRR